MYSQKLGKTDSPCPRPPQERAQKVLPIYDEPSRQQPLKERKEQKRETCSKPEANYGKCSEMPKGMPSGKTG